MYNFLIRLFILLSLSTLSFAQSIYFQSPPSAAPAAGSTAPTILSPEEFRNRVDSLDQQNQQDRAHRLEQLSNSLPGPLAAPAPKEANTKTPMSAPIAPAPPPIQQPSSVPRPATTAAPSPPPPTQGQPYYPGFQQSGTTPPPTTTDTTNGGGWNIKY